MNIFAVSKDPYKSAYLLDDKRCIKMILESTQLLCSGLIINKITNLNTRTVNDKTKYYYNDKQIYSLTHAKHPCTLWVSYSKENWLWLFNYTEALCKEYNKRYDKIHKSSFVLQNIKAGSHDLPSEGLSPFYNCCHDKNRKIDYRGLSDVHNAYKFYLTKKWEYDKNPTWYRKKIMPNLFKGY